MSTKEKIRIIPYDVTLREGPQTQGVNLSVESKLRIAQKLDEMVFPFIEGGWPGSNAVDSEFFTRMRRIRLRNSILTVFGRTVGVNETPENSEVLNVLVRSETEVVTVFGKSSRSHVGSDLGTTGERNLEMIYTTMKYLARSRRPFFDGEHFFDGFQEDPEYALKTLEAARDGDAEVVILCDTNGGSTPEFIYKATRAVRKRLGNDYPLGIHVHNDSGFALSGTFAAIRAGARQVQGTINGLGERAGNLDLLVFQADAVFKYRMDIGSFDLTNTVGLARFIEIETGVPIPRGNPYTGERAFCCKAGTHTAAMRHNPRAYLHIDPAWVGGEMFFEHSDQGGGANLLTMAETHGFPLTAQHPRFKELVWKMKDIKSFGSAQEFLFLYRELVGGHEPFEVLEDSQVVSTRKSTTAKADLRVRVNGDILQENCDGNGPINAFDLSLRKALRTKYPEIDNVELLRYQQPETQHAGSDVPVVVFAEFGTDGQRWTSKATSTNEQTAGENVFIDAYKYFLLKLRHLKIGDDTTEKEVKFPQ